MRAISKPALVVVLAITGLWVGRLFTAPGDKCLSTPFEVYVVHPEKQPPHTIPYTYTGENTPKGYVSGFIAQEPDLQLHSLRYFTAYSETTEVVNEQANGTEFQLIHYLQLKLLPEDSARLRQLANTNTWKYMLYKRADEEVAFTIILWEPKDPRYLTFYAPGLRGERYLEIHDELVRETRANGK